MTAIPAQAPEFRDDAPARHARRVRWGDAALGLLTRGSAVGVLLMLASLVTVLAVSAVPSLRTFGASFLVSKEWRPNELERPKLGADGKVVIEEGEVVTEKVPPAFGALPVIYGTSVSSLLSLVFAVPLSLGAALVIVRVAPRLRLAGILSFLIEFLAAIPSIAYGIWGLFVLTPFLRGWLEPGLTTSLGRVPGFSWMFTETVKVGGQLVVRPIPPTGRDLLAGGLIL